MTGQTYACAEPTIDYVVLKFPRWPFDKFVYADKHIGTKMKATGEIMAIGTNFETRCSRPCARWKWAGTAS